MQSIFLVSQNIYITYSGAAPRDREPETLSTHSDADAPNQVKVTNVLPPVQKCTYTVMTGCKSGDWFQV